MGTVTVTRFPSPVLSRHRPGRAGCPMMPCVSRTPTRSPSGRVCGAVRHPRRARLASTCHPEKPTQTLSASPTAPGSYDLTVSVGWTACWARGVAVPGGPPPGCNTNFPGAAGLQDSTTGPVPVNVREIQSVNG